MLALPEYGRSPRLQDQTEGFAGNGTRSLTMPKLSDRQQENRFIAMFVGLSGTGKTVAAASFPKPAHFDDFDGRIGGAQVPWLDLNGITYEFYPPKAEGLITKINKRLEEMLTASKLVPAIVQLPTTHVTDSLTKQTYAFVCQSIPLTHSTKKDDSGKSFRAGKWIGPIAMAGPEDYGLEAQATYDYLAFMKSMPIQNVIFTAHYVDRYERSDPENSYSESIVVGKKLSIRDKIGTNVQGDFDHIFEFERDVNKFYVRFRGEMARTSYSWLPNGRHEWTKQPFYEWMMEFKEKAK
jgi:hypothetical protein